MAQLGNVNIDGLDLSPAMRNDLSGGMSVAQFNSKYAGSGFQPISTARQVGAAAAAAPAPAAAPNNQEANWSGQLTSFADQTKASMQALLDQQKAEQQGLFNQYTDKLNSQEKLPDLYKRLSQELGLPELGNTVQGFKNDTYRVQALLDRLDEDVTSRTFGTLTSEGARNKILAKEGGDLNTQLARISNAMAPYSDQLVSAQNSLSTQMPLYVQQQERELKPIEMQISAAGDRFSREISGFTYTREQQLDALMDKLTRERQLADREWQLAQQLAAEEREYQRQKSLAASSGGSGAGYLGGGGTAATTSAGNKGALPNAYIGNNDLRGRLNYLASQGDSNAKTALQYVGNDGKYNLNPYVTNPAILNALNSFGFSNVYKQASAPAAQPDVSFLFKK